jgi:hypothetical protein
MNESTIVTLVKHVTIISIEGDNVRIVSKNTICNPRLISSGLSVASTPKLSLGIGKKLASSAKICILQTIKIKEINKILRNIHPLKRLIIT